MWSLLNNNFILNSIYFLVKIVTGDKLRTFFIYYRTFIENITFLLKTYRLKLLTSKRLHYNKNKLFIYTQVEGNVFAVYNMGTNDHPIGEVGVKVNDNQYHVVRFTRTGPNSTLQVDDYNLQSNHPSGKWFLHNILSIII